MKIKNNIFSTVILKFRQWLLILLILSVASILYIYQIDRESLWIDEIFSIRDAREISNLTLNRPLYFMLLHIWMRIGENEAWLRSLSVIFGLGSVWLIYWLGCRLNSKVVGSIAALILAISPLTINHAQEVRMYMLSMFLGIGGSLLLTYAIKRPTILLIASWILLRILAILTTPINTLLLLSDTIIVGWQLRKHTNLIFKWRRKILWSLGVLIIPSIIVIKDVVPPLFEFLETKNIEHKVQIGIPAFVGGITRFTLWELDSPLETLSWFYDRIFFNIYALVLLLLLAVVWLQKKKSISIFWLTAWGFLPLVILFLLAQLFPTLWGITRYSMFTAPYIFILLAAGLVRVWQWRKIVAIAIVGIYAIATIGALKNYYTITYREDWRGAVREISINQKPNDNIALFPDSGLPALTYYYQGNSPIDTLQSLPKERVFLPVDELFVQQMLNELPSIESRIWLVFTIANAGFNDENKLLEKTIDEKFDVEKYQEFSGIKLFLLGRKN